VRSRQMWAALALAVVLGGCSTDDDPGASPTDGSSSAGDPSGGTGSPSAEQTEGPEAATGKVLSSELASLHLPAGQPWAEGRGGLSGHLDIDARNSYEVHLSQGLGKADDLDTAVAAVLPTVQGPRPEIARAEDRDIAGVETAVLSGVDDRGYYYGIVAIHQGLVMTIDFVFPRKDAEGEAWIESILASVEWK